MTTYNGLQKKVQGALKRIKDDTSRRCRVYVGAKEGNPQGEELYQKD